MRWLAAALLWTGLLPAAPNPAERIASLSPAATRVVRDLGSGADIVLATRWCELPEGHPARRDADAFEPDLESLAAARPTLVLVPRLANPLLAARLRDLGLRTEVLAAESPASPEEDIVRIGGVLGKDREAARLIAARRELERGARGTRRILVVWDGVMAGPGSHLSWAIDVAGGGALPGTVRWPEWDRELVARYNPEIVLYLNPAGPATPATDDERLSEWRAQPVLRTTQAASRGCIYSCRASSDWLPSSGLPAAARTLRALVESSGVR